jgi:hypothetical protein
MWLLEAKHDSRGQAVVRVMTWSVISIERIDIHVVPCWHWCIVAPLTETRALCSVVSSWVLCVAVVL